MAVLVDEDIFRFEVAVDNVEPMKVMERKGYFGSVELCNRVWESLEIIMVNRGLKRKGRREAHIGTAEQSEQLSPRDKVHNHVKVRCILEGAPKVNDERMLNAFQHALFIVGVLNLLQPNNLFLAQNLDSIVPQVVFAPDYCIGVSDD